MRSILLAAAAATVMAASAPALAGWGITFDAERFRWSEDLNPTVTETGPMFGIGARWMQERDLGWRFAYRGRLYFGSVDYQGSVLGSNPQPISGTTQYRGLVNEGQLIYRFAGNPYGAEFVSGLIWDYWNRQLTSVQREEYWIASLRVGLNLDRRTAVGFFGGAGLKYPFWTREDAHLTEIGFNSNPRLKPKGQASFYAEAGYRFSRKWSLTAYYDAYRFAESDPTPTLVNPNVTGCEPPLGCNLVQPTSRVDSLGLRLQYSF
jgi:hypothetical protein